MTIDEAIEVLKDYSSATFEPCFVTFSKSLQLGIEALKREREYRLPRFKGHIKLLPGETDD